jgi:peroxiredoxin
MAKARKMNLKNDTKSKNWPFYLGFVVLIVAISWAVLGPFVGRAAQNPLHTHENIDPTTIQGIIKARKTWDPVFATSYGTKAPDFTFTDIAGKLHTLDEYRGKNIILVFWATWCPACVTEIPHLLELRQNTPADELAIIAISNETSATLKEFAARKKLNYTVTSVQHPLPAPYNAVRAIPTSFFIGKQGNIKLIAQGLVSTNDAKAILNAAK